MIKRQFYRSLIELGHGLDDLGRKDTWNLIEKSFKTKLCPICKSSVSKYHHTPPFAEDEYRPPWDWVIMSPILYLCDFCNWWNSTKEGQLNGIG